MAAIGKKTSHAVEKTNFEQLYGPREVYRQMDSDIILILHEKLSLTYPLPEAEIGHRLGLLELRFILTDLVWKLESITGVQKFDSEQSLQYIAKPGYFLHDLSKFLNIIINNMEMIGTAINEQLQRVEHTYSHVDLFTDEFSHLKVCYGLCVRLLADFFAWPEFATGARDTLLKDSLLAVLSSKATQQMRSKSIAYLAIEVFNRCHKYEAATVELKAAVHLYQLLMTLNRFASHASGAKDIETQRNAKLLPQELRSLCKKLLCRKWFNYDGAIEKGATCNLYLDHLIKGFVKDSDFQRQREILRILLEECKQMSGKDSSLKSFPNIKKQNFPLLFRALCEVLISFLSNCIATNATDYSDELKIWEKSCALLNMLLEILQSLDVPRDFQLFLKYAHIYLKLTLQRGLPIFEKYLRQSPERVNELLKSLQVTTRFLHNLCVHSKALKKIAIVSQIPFLRETVENLLFRVKALLAANKCSNVFWMGCLKNKDLHGDEVISEVASLATATPADSDEEIPEDDESIDETILDQNESKSTIGNTTLSHGNRSKSSSRSKCF